MNFTINAKTFAAVLARIQSIAAQRATMPILSHVLLEASALRPALHVSATDLEVGYQTVIDCEVAEHGSIAIPAKKLYEVIKASPVEHIAIQRNPANGRVTISAGTFVTTLAGCSPEDFPCIKVEPGEGLQLDAAALSRLIGHTDYAQSNDELKYHLCGTFLRIVNREGDWRLVAAATDGHRLAVDSVPLPGDTRRIPAALAKGVIVSRKGIAELRKLGKTGILMFDLSGNHLAVSTDSETLTIRLVDGDFPDYERIVPGDFITFVETNREPLIQAQERVTLLAADKLRGVNIRFAVGAITLDASNTELGDASDQVTATVVGEVTDRKFNGNYLDQALSAWDSRMVELKVPADQAPLLVHPHGEVEPFAVIMPMRG